MRDCGALNLLSSVTEDLVQPKKHIQKIIRVQTVIDDDFDEIVDFLTNDKNITEEISTNIQFELSEEQSTGGIFYEFCS